MHAAATVAVLVLGAAACAGPTARPTVALFGDSLSVQAAPYFHRLLEAAGIEVTEHVVSGSAACDLLPRMQQAARTRPTAAVVEFWGNTGTGCMAGCPPGSSATERYCAALERAIDAFTAAGTKVFLMGAPVSYEQWTTDDPHRDDLHHAFAALAALHPGHVVYVDAGSALEGPAGSFTWTLPCLAGERCTGPVLDGVRTNTVRAPDGLHFCTPPPSGLECPTYSSGAYRFALAMAAPVMDAVLDRGRP